MLRCPNEKLSSNSPCIVAFVISDEIGNFDFAEIIKSSITRPELGASLFGSLGLARWLLKLSYPLVTQTQELKTKVVPSLSTMGMLNAAIKFTGGWSMRSST